jgi:EAL and modified HD-GYP domain-containing signal transduction protein
VFDFFRRLGSKTAEPAPAPAEARATGRKSAADFARLNAEVPLKDAAEKHHFVRREAVLNRAEKVGGYEFSLVTRLQVRLTRRGGIAVRAYDSALLARLALDGVTSLLGRRFAFVNLSIESIDNEFIARLPAENTALIFEMTEGTRQWDGLAARFDELARDGFGVGVRISDAVDAECPLIRNAQFIQIDVPAFDGIDLRTLARKLKHSEPGGGKSPRLIARGVQSYDEYQFCYRDGFDFFLGPFISSRESLRPTHNAINRAAVLPILAMLRKDEGFSAIADQLKNEPTLTYKLLRYLNSAAMGMPQHIDSLTQAIVVLGREKFYRWISLLLFDFENPGFAEHMLAERALTRGRTLELLAGKGLVPNQPEHLFLIGLFSLLDQALGRPLPELIEQATLPDAVRDALLGHPGPYADALALVASGEADAAAAPEQLAQALTTCGIEDSVFAPAAAQGLVWANQVLGETA